MKKYLLFLTFLILTRQNVFSQVEGITLGVLLNQFGDKVENSVKLAENSGKGVIIQAGSTLYLAIENAKIAYKESLDKTFERLDATTQGTINQIGSLTTQLERQTAEDVDHIMSRSQTIISSLPFSNKQPQIGRFTPKYFAPSDQSYPVSIELFGNFSFASTKGYLPKLIVNGKTYQPNQSTNQSLKFLVPASDLAPQFNNSFNYSIAKVTIPYKKGVIFTSKKDAEYKLLIGVLPSSPGVVNIKHKIKNKVHEEQRKTTQGWAQHSSNDDITKKYNSDGFPGWHIKDPKFVVEWSQGNENDQWSKTLEAINPQVSYEVHTVHHGPGTSGKVNFHFDFTVERDIEVEEWKEETVQLKWGESKIFNYSPGSWTVVVDSFDGKHNEYSTSNLGNYIDINGSTTALQVQIKKPEQVIYP